MGDLNGAGDVGESEYGEKPDMRLQSGEGSIGDFNAIIAEGHPARSWKLFGLIGGQLLLGIPFGMGAGAVGVAWVIEARSICGAALEESRIRLQVDMQTIGLRVLEAGVLVGFFGQCLHALWMMTASKCCWLEDVPVVE